MAQYARLRFDTVAFGLHYAYRHDKLRWSVGLDYVRDGAEQEKVVGS